MINRKRKCPDCGQPLKADQAHPAARCIFNQATRPKSENKYGAKRVEKAGIWFDSKGESSHHDNLLMHEKAGNIRIEKIHDKVQLTPNVSWVVDFRIFDFGLNQQVWEEYKGMPTEAFRIKKNLWKDMGPGVLRIYYKDGRVEVIRPKGATECK